VSSNFIGVSPITLIFLRDFFNAKQEEAVPRSEEVAKNRGEDVASKEEGDAIQEHREEEADPGVAHEELQRTNVTAEMEANAEEEAEDCGRPHWEPNGTEEGEASAPRFVKPMAMRGT
jgi:hypothetical protein